MKNVLKVNYMIDNDDKTDEEYENQEESVFYITEDMIADLIAEHDPNVKRGDWVDNIFITKELQ